MKTPMTNPLSLLTANEIELLYYMSSKSFEPEQRGRFEAMCDDDPTSDKYANGTLVWCDSIANALLYMAIQRFEGFSAMLVDDLSKSEGDDVFIVLSSKPCEIDVK